MAELLSPDNIARLKFALALLTCGLLYLEARRARQFPERWKKTVAVVLAVLSIACYVDFFRHRSTRYYHRWELYHYYLGSKYAEELGYERLYLCAAIADAETGNRARVERRVMRNLPDNRLIESASVLDQPAACTRHFTPKRWEDFKADLSWFRELAGGGDWWDDMQKDHGYNPSPVWTVAGHGLSSIGPASHGLLTALSAIDVMLMVATIGALHWAFGWRLALIAVVFWGTQAPSGFHWTGGAFLRQDWLFLCALAAALMRKRYFFWAGAALGYAALLRLFPALLWLGPMVIVAVRVARRRKIPTEYRRLMAGGAVAACLLLPAGAVVAGPQAYPGFARHIAMHASTPISNHMSLRTLFAQSSETRLEQLVERGQTDPIEPWKRARRARLDRLRWLHWGVAALLLGWFVYTVARMRTLWLAMGLSLLPVVVLTDPSCYYHSMWVLAAVLTRARRSLEMVLVGVAGLGQLIAMRIEWYDDRYFGLAVLYLVLGLLLVFMFSRPLHIQRSS